MKHFVLYMTFKWILLFVTAFLAGPFWLISWVFHGLVWLFDKLPRWWYYEAVIWNESVKYYKNQKV